MIRDRISAPALTSIRRTRNIRYASRMSFLLVCFLLPMGLRVADAQCYTFSSGSSASLTVNLTSLPAPSNPVQGIYQYTSSTGLAGTVSLTVGQTKYTPASSPPITLILTVGDDPGINFSSFEISTGFVGTNNTVAAATVSLSWSGNLFPNGSLPVTLPPVSGASNPLMVVGVGATQTTYSSVSVAGCATSTPCAFTTDGSSAPLSQIGTATANGTLPEVPMSIAILPTSGATCNGNFTATSSASWLNATGGASSFSFTALTNPHPTTRSASISLGNANGGNAAFTVTEAGDPESLNDRQVRALYQSVLGRDPDSGGFAFWTAQGAVGLGQMLDLFLTSPEAFNSDFAVMAAYQAATGAPPTYSQFKSAVAGIRAGGSIADLFNSLISPTFTAQNLYQNLLNRTALSSEIASANTAGLAPWFLSLIGYPTSTAPVTAPNIEFMSTGSFHSGPDHTNGLYVALLYYVILGRDVDPSGYAFWVGVANGGGPGILFQGALGQPARLQILGLGTPGEGFAGSPEFQGLYQ